MIPLTTDDVRADWTYARVQGGKVSWDVADDEFETWLASLASSLWLEGATAVLREEGVDNDPFLRAGIEAINPYERRTGAEIRD